MQNLAQVAEEQLATRNIFNIPSVPNSAKHMGFYRIFNVNTFQPHWVQELGSLGTYLIPQAEEGFLWEPDKEDPNKELFIRRAIKDGETAYSRPCNVPKVVREGNPVDLRKIAFTEWDGVEVAADILGIGPNKRPSQDLTAWGCFLAEGDVPTKKELQAAMAKVRKKCEMLWNQAQGFYQQGPNHYGDITDVHRHADRILGRRAKWNSEGQNMIPCPGCGDSIFTEAAAHIICGAVLNEKKVIELKMKGFEHLWKK
jgi:hypothetical protein